MRSSRDTTKSGIETNGVDMPMALAVGVPNTTLSYLVAHTACRHKLSGAQRGAMASPARRLGCANFCSYLSLGLHERDLVIAGRLREGPGGPGPLCCTFRGIHIIFRFGTEVARVRCSSERTYHDSPQPE